MFEDLAASRQEPGLFVGSRRRATGVTLVEARGNGKRA